jgi:putative ABC transport system ATP-binding protein
LADALVELDRVTKRYGDVVAVDGLSLRVEPGVLVAVVGPSGSGKTTLLNLLAAWEAPDRGEVVRAAALRPDREGVVAWRSVAVVPQQRGLLDDLTLGENVTLPLRLAGVDAALARDRVDDLLGRCRIDHLADRLPHEVSLGEQQRASLARALVVEPVLLLADEPTAHQDASSALVVLEALRTAVDAGAGCVMVTHDPDARRVADVVIELASAV